MIKTGSPARILGFFQRLTSDERLYAVGLCLSDERGADRHRRVPQRAALLGARAVHDASASTCCARRRACCTSPCARIDGDDAGHGAELVLVHDMSFIERRSEETRRYLFYFFAALALSASR